ncbi:MAG TPA: CBS domain-containing protein, partial [Chitinophagaceae bacterium]|nr:CBS domain-containing protein [Chitinophagaceae bacterium]
NDSFVGILTDHEIATRVMSADRPLHQMHVIEFTNRQLPVATLNDSLEYCMQMMERHNARYLAIYDSFTFKGVVSLLDLMKEALNKRQALFGDKLEDYHPHAY